MIAPEPRADTVTEKRRVEAMVTAILLNDGAAQALVAEGLTASEERYVRAGASIVAAFFQAFARQMGAPAAALWQKHMEQTTDSRRRHGRD